MQDCVAEEEYNLIDCFSVAPGNVAQEIDQVIMKNLYWLLGKEVSRKCIILITYSDHAHSEYGESAAEYVKYIKSCAIEFQRCIQGIGVDFPTIKTVFDGGISTGILAIILSQD